MKTTLEIVCSSADDAVEAEAGGADRIELCGPLSAGGLTPSLGTLIEVKKHVRIPVMAMARPRPAGFCYSHGEFETMLRDAELLVEHGADGVVFGVLLCDGSVDVERSKQMREVVKARQAVFHRAFDVMPDPLHALEQLIELGVTRVLTSGQQPRAIAGADLIRRLVEDARGRIEILPGGGIRAHNVHELLMRTGCTQVHLAAFAKRQDSSTAARPQIKFGIDSSDETAYELTDRAIVRDMRDTLDAYAHQK